MNPYKPLFIFALLVTMVFFANIRAHSIASNAITSPQNSNDYALNPVNFEQDIAIFMGLIRTKPDNAKTVYMHPNSELQFEYMVDKYGATPLDMFYKGMIPIIKYQSLSSALVLFYNPWNDLVFITEWQVFENEVFITDMELVSADFLQFDGSIITFTDPLWLRKSEDTPIDNLYAQMTERNLFFNELWDVQFGPGNWREVLISLKEPEYIIREQSVVALRLRNHYINLMDLTKSEHMVGLRDLVIQYLNKLDQGIDGVFEVYMDAKETPDETFNVLVNVSPELWGNSATQIVLKVDKGAFVFISSPKLPKYFLSLYFDFKTKTKLELKRIDWCSFDSNL